MSHHRDARQRRARLQITPATVLATVALIFAAGGGAYATTTTTTTTAGTGPAVYWAVVNADGTLARHSAGVRSSKMLISGAQFLGYQVVLSRDVTQCAYAASIGDPGTASAPGGQIEVASREGKTNGVSVVTMDSSGLPQPNSFHLIVTCG